MSISIIEEALDSVEFFIEDIEETTKLFIHQAKTALEQARKQEKLLGHYKDLAEVRKELYDLTINFKQSNKDRMIVLFTQETLVSNIIKEIENDK